MGSLGAFTLLDVWDHGRGLDPVRRALLLLEAAWPDYDRGEWSRLTIGTRDQWLVHLRAGLFGTRFEVLADCPACGTTLETVFTAADLPSAPAEQGPHELRWNGYRVGYRLPTSEDLLAVLDAEDETAPADRIFARCIDGISRSGRKAALSDVDATLRARVEAAMAERDLLAEIDVGLTCRACAHRFQRRFDILDHLWGEIGDWAERILSEVHVLASAYGWSEDAVLRLSPARRHHYLELVSA